jgi:hypothetical protein
MEDHPMTNHASRRLHRRTLLTGSATLGASAVIACDTSKIAIGQQIMATVEQNTTKRRGVGLRALNPEHASAGFTLFAPLIWKNKNSSVYLIDLHGNVVHTWRRTACPRANMLPGRRLKPPRCTLITWPS